MITIRMALAVVCLLASAPVHADDTTPAGFKLLEHNEAVRWAAIGAGTPPVVTWAFATTPMMINGAANCPRLDGFRELAARSDLQLGAVHAQAVKAFVRWEAAAGVQFREIEDAESANILIGAQGDPDGHAFTDVTYATGEGSRVIARSLVCLNPMKRWKIGFDGDLRVYDLQYTLTHEIGHAIGLDHADSAGQIMSTRYGERFHALQGGDIAGARLLYGPPRQDPASQMTSAATEVTAPAQASASQSRALTSR